MCSFAGVVRFGARHPNGRQTKVMKQNCHDAKPTRPTAAVRLLRTLVQAVRSQQQLTTVALAAQLGLNRTTLLNWLEADELPQLDLLLHLLERLSVSERSAYFTNPDFCRVRPALQHPCLAHDRTQLSRLHRLLSLPHGVIVLSGGTGETRTFVAHALAQETGDWQGVDAHVADWFVPAPGIHCGFPPGHPEVLDAAVTTVLDRTRLEARLCFNGCDAVLGSHGAQLVARAPHQIVLLAGAAGFTSAQLARFAPTPVFPVMLTGSRERIEVQCPLV